MTDDTLTSNSTDNSTDMTDDTLTSNSTGARLTSNSTGTIGALPAVIASGNTTETNEEPTMGENATETVPAQTGGSIVDADGTTSGGMNGTAAGGKNETSDMSHNIFSHSNDTQGLIDDDGGQTPPPKNQILPPQLQVLNNVTGPPTGSMPGSNALGGNGFRMAVITLASSSVVVLGSLVL
jgi:hypothetical protein